RAVQAARARPRPALGTGAGRDRMLRAGERAGDRRPRDTVARLRADPRREDRRLDAAGAIDGGAPRVAVPDEAPQCGHLTQRPLDEDVGGVADAAGAGIERAVDGVAEDRHRIAVLRVGEWERQRL